MQNDARWKNVKISTKTIGAVGCTTTCMAMMYSYKYNKTVYPDKMCRDYLRYSGNELIWSSAEKYGFTREKLGDTRITTDMLRKIYNKLASGKPVTIGSYKNSYNGHWVVIKGFSGNPNNLSASQFTILDPSNSSRTSLYTFLTYYPLVNSIVY